MFAESPRWLAAPLMLGTLAAGILGPGNALAARCTGEQPVLLIVQDRSNSMWADPSPSTCGANCTSKWAIAQQVVPDVVSQFTGSFRYGLMVYPGDRVSASCTTGILSLPVGSTPLDISNAYLSSTNGPIGATPSALTLAAARTYLDSLNLNAPAHVLLITDGVPNCNESLDPNTCRGGMLTCTGGAATCNAATTGKYCLDDTRTAASAASLFSGGHKVFVVGFGSDITSDHNAGVLNAVAAAGGTGTAYSAQTSVGLDAALQQVITVAQECCTDACTAAADPVCAPSGGSRNVCVLGAEGCYVWQNQACNAGNACNNGQCTSCNSCTAGATRCGLFGSVETCTADAQGCTSWNASLCANGTTCQGNHCQACNTTCTAGQQVCDGNGTRTCAADLFGCTSWTNTTPCPSGTLCNASAGQCQSCTGACVAGSRNCTDASHSRECVADVNGCTSWNSNTCNAATTCNGGTCSACNGCTLGDARCAGSNVQSCTADAQGCTAWHDTSVCARPSFCQAGQCQTCPDTCTLGARSCAGLDIQECVVDETGCNGMVTVASCSAQQQCVAGACCTSTCSAGAVQCGANGVPEVCGATPAGCNGWIPQTACVSGQSCLAGACLQDCIFSGEVDSCPEGFTCTPDATGGHSHCVGSSSSSSSSGGASTSSSTSSSSGQVIGRPDAGVGTSGGAGNEEDPVTPSNCGCETSGHGGQVPLVALGMMVLGLLGVRRRR